MDWIINNQLGRRNITDFQKVYLRGLQYEREKKKVGGDGNNQYTSNVLTIGTLQSKETQRTSERLAIQNNVAPSTLRKDAQFAKAIDGIAENLGEDISC